MSVLLVAAILVSAPPAPPPFVAVGTADEALTGPLASVSLSDGVQIDTPTGTKAVKGLVSLRRTNRPVPPLPVGAQLITASGDRIPGSVSGGDTKVIQFRPALADEDWAIALDTVAAVWLGPAPADTPSDPARYAWLVGSPPRDVLLYRNGDAVRGALGGFTDSGVKFTPDGATAREVPLADLAAVGFNPRFARARKPKGPYAHLALTDGTRLDATEIGIKNDALIAKMACGPLVAVPLSKIVALDVMQGPAVALSDLKPKKVETSGFLGDGWPWTADRTVRGHPLRLLTADGETTADNGLGTHPRTVLTYDLGGAFARFDALVGLDAATGKRGRASVRVRLDGKEVDLPDLKALTAGPAIPVKLNVRGAKELTLVVDFGPTGDVQADVNWGHARLIRD